MSKKFKKRYVIIPLLCTVVIGGTVAGLVLKHRTDSVAKVVSAQEIAQMNGVYWDEMGNFSGTVKNGTVQNLTLGEQLEVSKVNVKKGDKVKKGDTLLEYDTKSLQLNVEETENLIKKLENDVKIAENELAVMKKLKPSEEVPKEDEEPEENIPNVDSPDNVPKEQKPVFEKEINLASKPLAGDGSKENPFVFNVMPNTVVKAEYLRFLSGGENETDSAAEINSDSDFEKTDGNNAPKYAVLAVYDETGEFVFSWKLNGSLITEDDIADWQCLCGVEIDEDGNLSVTAEKKAFTSLSLNMPFAAGGEIVTDTDMDGFDFDDYSGDFQGVSPDSLPDDNTDNSADVPLSGYTPTVTEKDNYVYSRDELKKMISDKEADIKKLGFNKKQAEIDLKIAQQKLKSGKEVAKIDGTVTFVAESKEKTSKNGEYIIITGSNGLSIVGSIDEFSISDISVDMPVSVTDYSSGSIYDGVITEISDTPSSSSGGMYGQNLTMSYYDFTVTVEGDMQLKEGDEAGITILNEAQEEDPLTLEMAFIRKEGSRYYVMAANEDNVLEKRYIKIGKIFFGNMATIESGVEPNDRLALPYGNVYEGMPVVDTDYNGMYGMFF